MWRLCWGPVEKMFDVAPESDALPDPVRTVSVNRDFSIANDTPANQYYGERFLKENRDAIRT